MPKWKKDAKEFTVSITHNVSSGTSFSYIPKPVLELLGNPKNLKFEIHGKKINVSKG